MKVEIIWQGKGGEGIKTAANLLCSAINKTQYFCQSFPEYGPERSGAKINSYIRISDREIKSHYPLQRADVIVSTFEMDIKSDKTILILASNKLAKDNLKFYLPASKIAKKYHISHINMALLGANLAILENFFNIPPELILKAVGDILEKKYNPEQSAANFAMIEFGIKDIKKIL